MPKALFLTLKTTVSGIGYPDLRGIDMTRDDAAALTDGYGWTIAQESIAEPPDTVLVWCRSTATKLNAFDTALPALDARCGMIGEIEEDE